MPMAPASKLSTDTVSAVYAHEASMGLCSVVPHAWLPTFGVPDGLRAIPLPAPRRSHQVGLVLAGHGPESLLARAMVETAREIDLAALLDQAPGH